MAGQGKLVCCKSCGRDTRSINGICYRCGVNAPLAEHINDQRDRRSISMKTIAGSTDNEEIADLEGDYYE